jgi:adenosine kinase
MNPIVPADAKDILDSDAFVFVPVTDFEISLDTLKYIKANSQGAVIFDAHGPTNACTRRGERLLQFWIDREMKLCVSLRKNNIVQG